MIPQGTLEVQVECSQTSFDSKSNVSDELFRHRSVPNSGLESPVSPKRFDKSAIERFSSMTISVTCGSCNKEFKLKDEAAGIKFRCSRCGERVRVPSKSSRTERAKPKPEPELRAEDYLEPVDDDDAELSTEDFLEPVDDDSGKLSTEDYLERVDDDSGELSTEDFLEPVDDDEFEDDEPRRKKPTRRKSESQRRRQPASKGQARRPKPFDRRPVRTGSFNFNRLNVVMAFGGLVMMFIGYREYSLVSLSMPTAKTISMADLLEDGPGDNIHLHITNMLLWEGAYVYEADSEDGPFTMVWIPAISSDSETGQQVLAGIERGASPTGHPPNIQMILRTDSCVDENAVGQLMLQGLQTGIKGMIINEITSLGSDEKKLLSEEYPGVDFEQCYIFEQGREPAGRFKMVALMFGGTLLSLAGGFLLLGTYAREPQGLVGLAGYAVIAVTLSVYFSFGGRADEGPPVAAAEAGEDVQQREEAATDSTDEESEPSPPDVDVRELAGSSRPQSEPEAAPAGSESAPAVSVAETTVAEAQPENTQPTPSVSPTVSEPKEEKQIVPSSGIPVTSSTPLAAGDTLQAEWAGSWYEVQVLEVLPGDMVKIHWTGWASTWDRPVPRSDLQMPPGSTATASTGAAGTAAPAGTPTPAAIPTEWNVQVDPPTVPVEFAAAAEINVPAPDGSIKYASLPSEFVAIGGGSSRRELRDIWSLKTGKKYGSIGGVPYMHRYAAVSPGGDYFAVKPTFEDEVLVWDVQAGEGLRKILAGENPGQLSFLDFAGPHRMVTLGSGTMMVWKLPEGEVESTFKLPDWFDAKSVAFSPGGRYVTALYDWSKKLRFYDTTTGEIAGETSNPSETGCAGLVFSDDGTELAGLFAGSFKKTSLVCWDVATGRVLDHFELEQDLQSKIPGASKYQGRALEWFPDKSKWLVYGHAIVDRQVGQPVWNIPVDPSASKIPPRRPVDDQHVALIGGSNRSPVIKSFEIPVETVEKASEIVAGGGTAVDVGLPPLSQADWSATLKLNLDESPGWQVPSILVADPVEPLMSKPIEIDAAGRTIESAILSGSDTARLLVAANRTGTQTAQEIAQRARSRLASANGTGEDAAPANGPVSLEMYDLLTSEQLKAIPINYPAQLLGFSLDGTRAALKASESPERIDVWDVETGSHVAGWRPYEKIAGDNQSGRSGRYNKLHVAGAVFVDANHLLTLNNGAYGREKTLVLWELPACRAVYQLDGPETPKLSPDGSTLVVSHGESLRFINALTGEIAGSLSTKGRVDAVGFHHKGNRIAATMTFPGGNWLTAWNVQDGSVAFEFPLPRSGSSLQWCGDDYVLLNDSALIDVEREMVVWTYQLPWGRHVSQNPDGRHWYLVQVSGGKPSVRLNAVTLPGPQLADRLATENPKPSMVLEPGDSISINLQLIGSIGGRNFTRDVATNLQSRFAKHRIRMTNSSGPTFRMNMSEKNTGETAEFRAMGFRNESGMKSIQVKQIEVKLALESGGTTHWEQNMVFQNASFGMQRIPEGESIESYLDKQMRQQAADYVSNLEPPIYVFAEGASIGLGQSQLPANSFAGR